RADEPAGHGPAAGRLPRPGRVVPRQREAGGRAGARAATAGLLPRLVALAAGIPGRAVAELGRSTRSTSRAWGTIIRLAASLRRAGPVQALVQGVDTPRSPEARG